MKFASRVLTVAGWSGLLVLAPMYLLEARTGHDFPPPITHPEYYYGFVGVALAWQVAFLIMARDPLRYRPLLVPAVMEKLLFGGAAILLAGCGRSPWTMMVAGGLDLAFAFLFSVAWIRLKDA
jgi:hypothetical protein